MRKAQVASRHYLLGVCLVLLSAVVLSTLGIGLRQIESASGWQILFYRSISFTLTLLIIVAIRSHGHVIQAIARIGIKGIGVGALLALASSMIVFAMLNTTVANATFVISTTPFFAAALGWLLLGESVSRATWLMMIVAVIGIGVMLTDGLRGGGLLGILLAFGVALCTGLMLVTVRGSRDIDMIPALGVAGILTAVFTACVAPSLDISNHDRVVSIALGCGQYAIGFALLTTGTRYVPVAQAALLGLLESVLGPLWVWIGVGEEPSMYTLVGGFIVLGATLTQAWLGLRRR